MNRYLVGAVALFAVSSAPALAADLAARPYVKAAPMIAAVYDWSGFYIGGNGGGGSSRKCWDAVTAAGAFIAAEGCHDATGGFAGGQIGYRWQSAAWVFGLEAQGDWADLKGSQTSSLFVRAPGDLTNRSKINSFGLFTGQVGYAWNNALLYVKGGAAVTNDRYSDIATATGIVGASASETRWGGTVGVGLEYGFTPNWSLGVEYDHLFMGTRNNGFNSTGAIALVGPAGTLVA